MNLFEKINRMNDQPGTFEEKMYRLLMDKRYNSRPYEKKSLADGMSLINQSICGWWKPRFLIDDRHKCAYEFMDGDERLTTVTEDDIDWESLRGLSEKAIERAKSLSFHYPSFIYTFRKSVAEVCWQLNPDGYYFMDDDGYGMTNDEEINIYGYVDRTGKPVTKFRYVEDTDELQKIRQQAEKVVTDRSINKRDLR